MSRLLQEIDEQPDVLPRVIENFMGRIRDVDDLVNRVHSGAYSNIILTGMGASYYSCYPVWLKLCHLGFPVVLWDTSELVNFAPDAVKRSTLVIAVSQSGESAEIKKLFELQVKPGFTLGITNSSQSFLAAKADLLLDLSAGEEESISTKTYLATLAALHLLGAEMAGNSLSEEIIRLISISEKMRTTLARQPEQTRGLDQFLQAAKHITILGRGFSLASANYGALISEEAARFPAAGLSAAQFRHGPMEVVNAGFYSVVLAGSPNVRDMNLRLAGDIARLGGNVIMISSSTDIYADASPHASLFPWPILSVEPDLLPMLEIIPLQQLVISLAAVQGIEAGNFNNSGKVTLME